jgi:hypothetical protein
MGCGVGDVVDKDRFVEDVDLVPAMSAGVSAVAVMVVVMGVLRLICCPRVIGPDVTGDPAGEFLRSTPSGPTCFRRLAF